MPGKLKSVVQCDIKIRGARADRRNYVRRIDAIDDKQGFLGLNLDQQDRNIG
jgi:hypothetical protein